MKSKKSRFLLLLTAIAVVIFFVRSAPPPPPPSGSSQDAFEQFPPIPTEYWVQQLTSPLPDSSNVIMRIHYVADTTLPDTIVVYRPNGDTILFHDDGLTCDSISHDGIYAAYLKENIAAFITGITTLEANLVSKRSFISFTGHLGEVIDRIPHFDTVDFNAFRNTPIPPQLINGADCGTALKKQNSLFITALSVVEDPARTFTPAYGTNNDAGTKGGVWTFRHLIEGIVNNGGTNKKKDFLKAWLLTYLSQRNINGFAVPKRDDIVDFLIDPWIRKASTSTISGTITTNNWESYWASCSETNLLDYAPFKLTAIVNRMDLRGNAAYNPTLKNAGETRFIFTLVPMVNIFGTEHSHIITENTVPFQDGVTDPGKTPTISQSQLDWAGMNIIFEYGNPQSTVCDAQVFAQSWLDLSAETLDDATINNTYNSMLENITETVVTAGAGGSGKVNGSALNRIRTNERIFFPARPTIGSAAEESWGKADWEMSQFELDATTSDHFLLPVPVTNTPQVDANNSTRPIGSTNTALEFTSKVPVAINGFSTVAGDAVTIDGNALYAIRDWVFQNGNSVAQGNYQIPTSYTAYGTTKTVKLAGTALVTHEQGHFWDFDWDNSASTSGFYPGYTSISASLTTKNRAQKLRQQFSLNTCQGCHSGETKTIFTHVRPVAYNTNTVSASTDYWENSPAEPAYDQGTIDTRFVMNSGHSKINGFVDDVYSMISPTNVGTPINYGSQTTGYYQRVSAFLTGRKYNGGGDWQDDFHFNADDNTDNLLDDINSLYYVYDPTDQINSSLVDVTKPGVDRANGYNDLQMRKQNLCQFVNLNCNNSSIILELIQNTRQIPTSKD